ncbi:hotdog fold thioesterase [Brachybacterium hainanense]|uniref:Hotdog fold thioesterase n=1 Tax=Brachybacterium hainanense TaxID=1541174 RepID=A0ABV6RG31_9MICO
MPSHARPGPAPDSDVLEAMRRAVRGTLIERTEMEILSLDAEGGVMTMPVEGNTQPAGLLHGGATIALAESVASMAAILQARAVHGEGAQAVGTSVSAVHHRSARSGVVTAACRALHRGRQVASYLVEISDESGALLSTVTVSTMLLAPRPS